jgi:hypothetical protein
LALEPLGPIGQKFPENCPHFPNFLRRHYFIDVMLSKDSSDWSTMLLACR